MQTLFRKRDKGTSAFALVLDRGRFRFVINLGNGRAASVSAPGSARVGELQHVAATYDGAVLRLYLDGREVATRAVAGTIPPGPGPLLIGNDGSERRFDGIVDEAAFDLHALPPERVLHLTCIPLEPSVTVSPGLSAPTTPDVPVTFDIAVRNNNPAACLPMDFMMRASDVSPELNVDPEERFQASPPVPSGATTHFSVTVTPFDVVEFSFGVPFDVFSLDWEFGFFSSLGLDVSEPAECHVSKARELLIQDLSVIADPFRTNPQRPASDPRTGAWTFKHLVEEMAPTPADAPAMVEDMLRSFLAPQVINGFTIAPRPEIAHAVLNGWPRTSDGELDLALAPVHLLAIVNRIDLRDVDRGNAGQANFVFAFADRGFDMQATLLFEYKLPAATEADVLDWARAFHALGAEQFSERYNTALQAITDRVVRRGARPGGVNGSALHAVRTHEFPFGGDSNIHFELREFRLSPTTGRLVPAPLDGTPDRSFNGTAALGDFITANRDAILAGTHTVPDQLGGQPFRAGAIFNLNTPVWNAPGVDGDVRRAFAISTCNGCHSSETGTFTQQIVPLTRGVDALSPFLRGVTVADPITGEPRTFNDMLRRRLDLEAIVCPPEPTVSLRRGISRVH